MSQPVPYLLVEHLTKSVGDKVLFRDLTFALNRGDRIALIARNGIGKSTLMDILMGQSDYDSGRITFRNDLTVHYLPQQPPILLGEESLSGGERKRRAIQRVLDDEPDLLLLDEPTNHLDLDTVVWLEDYLVTRTQRGDKPLTLLMVTHDRYFLDRVCTDILEIDHQQLFAYHGNYSYYVEKRAERIEQQNAEADKYRNLYRTELEWMRRMPQARGHKAQYRIDNFYEIERRSKRVEQTADVRLETSSGYIGNKIFEAKHVSKSFVSPHSGETKVILRDFSYVFSRYEKLGIIGHNGTGKSTFLKLLLGLQSPDEGSFDIGSTVRFGYYAQTGLDIEPGKKVIDVVRDIAETVDMGDGNRLTASQFLQQFLFSPSQQYDYVDKLSGGEKQRLHLCMVLMKSPNFLILDEPTNDLDIPTLNVLEQYLRDFHGCVIVVSHDRYFMDKVVDHLFVFHGEGEVQDFPGNYTQYREYARLQQRQQQEIAFKQDAATKKPISQAASSTQATSSSASTKPKKLSFKEKQELASIEQQLPLLEQEKADLELDLSGRLSDPQQIASASERYRTVCEQLDELELRWLELSEV